MLRTAGELDQDDHFKEGVPSGDMWAAISSRIEQSKELSSESLHSKPLHSKHSTLSAEQKAESTTGVSGFRKWFSGWQGHLVTGALAAGAVFFLTRQSPTADVEQGTSPRVAMTPDLKQGVSEQKAKIMPVAFEQESQPPEVEHLEVFDGEGMVLTVPGENGDTAVIWVSSDRDVEGPL